MPSQTEPLITKDFFAFFRELGRNNNKEWFTANKPRFEQDVLAPAVRFVEQALPELRKISPHVNGVPKAYGGSISRIYRDTRFSKDKRPYNDHLGIHFSHAKAGKGAESYPGYFVHLAPGDNGAYAGVWRPEGAALKGVRDAIARDPAAWKRATKPVESFIGQSLKRPPPGYDPNHPLMEDLKRKDFVGRISFTDGQVASPRFLKDFVAAARSLGDLNAFTAKAVKVPW